MSSSTRRSLMDTFSCGAPYSTRALPRGQAARWGSPLATEGKEISASILEAFRIFLEIFQHFFRPFSGLQTPYAAMLSSQKQRGGQPLHIAPGGAMARPDDQSVQLSVYRAFVVQFDTHTDVACGRLAGRVEHVVSGQATQFHSLPALLRFIDQLLHAQPGTTDDGEP